MTDAILSLKTSDLIALATALRMDRISPPFTSLRLQSLLPRDVAQPVSLGLQRWIDKHFSASQIADILELIIQDRKSQSRIDAEIELVTTGPVTPGVLNRDTSVVVREMFAGAKETVLVAGFAVFQGQQVFQSLADRIQELPDIQVRLFFDIQRKPGNTSISNELVRQFGENFKKRQWPKGCSMPELFYDPRSLETGGEKRACLHAKCIVVDHKLTFISSANFTEAAQQRNIEVGLLIQNTSLAIKLSHFFDTMLAEKLLRSVF